MPAAREPGKRDLGLGRCPAIGPPAMTYTSPLLRLLDERGYIHQATDAAALDALASKQVVPGYIGFDATAPSLHVGSLVQIMLLRTCSRPGTSRSC